MVAPTALFIRSIHRLRLKAIPKARRRRRAGLNICLKVKARVIVEAKDLTKDTAFHRLHMVLPVPLTALL